MATRGPYQKGIVKREEILRTALTTIAESGYSGATVKQLADAVGLSPNGLLRYFGSKDALFTEVLRRRDVEDEVTFRPAGADLDGEVLATFIRHNAEVPGLVQLYARFCSEAAEPGHPAHDYFRERYEALRRVWTDGLDDLKRSGRLAADADTEQLAVVAIAVMDGLQTQWMYDPSIDMAEAFALAFERLVTSA
ncbi:TetR/AcrR family transcriptional regulator [Actinotalea sp. M2MS4P-6]|uniref:TetR/AcrR family transcriptional regulator n=1 Tax=Actinotalea sp. M2MS4P-6 TaxID=2983762 RepID=UPI0021E4E823|nr:TetR/AcrR family transcriptional regulator [Actinotalea sp. M2MS4P-6]MCV2395160.1 TetR/AcrR family transcriptional regulator [Actinotalea sp. M2MS4P-6]